MNYEKDINKDTNIKFLEYVKKVSTNSNKIKNKDSLDR
jgi:hypothetical protein